MFRKIALAWHFSGYGNHQLDPAMFDLLRNETNPAPRAKVVQLRNDTPVDENRRAAA